MFIRNQRARKCVMMLTWIGFATILLQNFAHGQGFTPTRFTVADAGTAGKPDVVLIPGLNSSRAVWAGEAKLLAPNYRLHLLQIDGFAGQLAGPNASGPILPAVVTELHSYVAASGMHPVVIGHSMGGLIALMLAEQHPGDVRKLVIVDALPAAAAMMGPGATAATMQPQLEAMRQQMLNMPADQYAAMQPMMAARLVKNADAQKMVAASAGSSDRTVAVNAMIEDLQTDVTPGLAATQTPTLLLYPLDPDTQKPEQVDALYTEAYRTMPHVSLKRVDGSRHFIMYDQPAAFDQAVEAFLK
ncbi:alpha/beta fold hydrolase [Terriglobus sp.]|uniref:alpha/beta fold hydrolase n=1 Tax=Terriglobus sp. TaxID=1889013 RepID=UPI003AFFEF15